ncbi:DNA polymerase III subunit beta family protein [Psychrobacter sp. AOP7-A1-24]|uniref:DNA polymerase III subunit beta family protein n=1 Tax=Psychrobacter sp. AOP7-A1-24 TaxID=3457646 RepID=UPI00402B4740
MDLIELKTAYLKAMLCAAAKEDVRYYLEGVYFVGGDNKVLAYSTDGRQLLRWIVSEDYQGDDFSYILNRRCIKDAIKTKYHIHLEASTGDLVCAKDEDFRKFKGLIDGKYPDVKRVVSGYVDNINSEKDENILINASYLKSLSKIGKTVGKHYKLKDVPIRLYSSKPLNHITNIFTFNGNKNLMYIVTSCQSAGTTDEEHHAVLLDEHPIPKNETQQWIDEGFGAICSVSNKSPDDAKGFAEFAINRKVIVDYDDDGYMDSTGKIWRFVYFIDAVEPNSHFKQGVSHG